MRFHLLMPPFDFHAEDVGCARPGETKITSVFSAPLRDLILTGTILFILHTGYSGLFTIFLTSEN
jgi:hypothetical protein